MKVCTLSTIKVIWISYPWNSSCMYIGIYRYVEKVSCSQFAVILHCRISKEDGQSILPGSVFCIYVECSRPQINSQRKWWTRYPCLCSQAPVFHWQAQVMEVTESLRGVMWKHCCLKCNHQTTELVCEKTQNLDRWDCRYLKKKKRSNHHPAILVSRKQKPQ